MTEAQLRYLVEVQDRDLKELQKNIRETNKALGTETPAAGKKAGQSYAAVRKSSLIAGAALAGGLALGAKAAWGELAEAQKVGAQTNAVIKSTGGLANVSAKEVDGLASSLMGVSGVDDELIKSGENVLLTFTRIRNETGRGNDIFNQATKATLDLSVALGKDMQGSAILVGKALNDPIKGMGALSRAGIQFTAEQKDQIKSMVASGNAMGAQKMILKELTTEFGGSAKAAGETLPGQLNKARESALNFGAELLKGAIPALGGLASGLNATVKFMAEHERATKIVIGLLAGLSVALLLVSASLKIARAAVALYTAAQWLANTAVLGFPLIFIIAALVAVGAAVILLWKRSETFREIVTAAWAAIKAIATSTANWIQDNVVPIMRQAMVAIEAAVGLVRTAFGWIRDHGAQIWTGLQIALVVPITTIKLAILSIEVAVAAVRAVFAWIRDHGAGIWNALSSALAKPLGVLSDAFEAVADGIGKIRDGLKWIGDNLGRILGWVDKLTGPLGRLGGLLGKIPGVGDPFDPNMTMPTGTGVITSPGGGLANLLGAGPELQPFGNLAAAYGLTVTSGYRPGAITANGTPSDHGKRKAIDVSNGYNTPQMAAFFRALVGNPLVKQAFYDPLGSIFGGAWSSYREGGHTDHVHVATYDRGGWLEPGYTLAYNGTGQRERVVGPGGDGTTIVVNVPGLIGSKTELAAAIRDALLDLPERSVLGDRA